MSKTVESYLLRRAVCGMTTKNYNRVFLALTRNLRRNGFTAETLAKALTEQTGESAEWPTDEVFSAAWRTRNIYQTQGNIKLAYILFQAQRHVRCEENGKREG